MAERGPFAAVDIGTHSTRLLIANIVEGAVEQILRRTTVTKLGRGVDSRGRLDPDTVWETLTVLSEYKGLCDGRGASEVRAVATSALRDAEDRDDFLDEAAAVLGFRPEVITGDEEARFSFVGASSSLPADFEDASVALIDIGGGSTEIALGAAGAIARRQSLPLGCLRLTERFLTSDPPTNQQLDKVDEFCREQLAELSPEAGGGYAAVGVAGTITSLLAIRDRVEPYDPSRIHHGRLSVSDVGDLLDELSGMGLEERRALPGLDPNRADVIVAGAAVLLAIMEVFGFPELVVSEADILDGVLLDAFGGAGS